MEALFNKDEGYKPLVLTENWQLAQLNYAESQNQRSLFQFDRHTFTDETFTLVEGRSILITYDEKTGKLDLTCLEKNVTYNVPTMMWHNIAMREDAIVLITEGRDAHLKGCDNIPIPEDMLQEIIKKCDEYFAD